MIRIRLALRLGLALIRIRLALRALTRIIYHARNLVVDAVVIATVCILVRILVAVTVITEDG